MKSPRAFKVANGLIPSLMLIVGLLLAGVCRFDMLGPSLPGPFWKALTVAVALWLVGAVLLVRKSPLLVIPAALLLYLLPFNFSALEPVGVPNESRLLEYFRDNNVVGAVVGMHVNGQTYFAGYGGVNKLGELPSAQTQYQIASVTKTFTGHLLSQQFEPALVPLATHSSGLPDITEGKGFLIRFLSHPFDFYKHYNATDLERDLAYFRNESGEEEKSPTSAWRYSNLGFCSLGLKLGMANSRFGNIGYARPQNVAAGYNAAAVRTSLWSPGICHGAGGLHASAADLLGYVRRPTLAKVVYYDDGEHTMGLGWMLSDGIWYHGGATFGNTAFVAHEPSSDTALVILISGVAREIDSFGLDFVKHLLLLQDAPRSNPACGRADATPTQR